MNSNLLKWTSQVKSIIAEILAQSLQQGKTRHEKTCFLNRVDHQILTCSQFEKVFLK